MTHNYLLIMADAQITTATRFYKVAVGTSRQADRDFLYLTALSVERGYYFERWSAEVCDFYRRICESMQQEHTQVAQLAVRLVPISARELVRSIKHGEAPAAAITPPPSRHHMLSFLSLNYRLSDKRYL